MVNGEVFFQTIIYERMRFESELCRLNEKFKEDRQMDTDSMKQ